jgi:hypothetical protein
LLALEVAEEVEKLPPYFRADELASLLTWVVHKNKNKLPNTLCAVKEPRKYLHKLQVIEAGIYLTPYRVFPRILPDLQFNGFLKVPKIFVNTIELVPNKDIFFTSYMCRSGLPKMPCKISLGGQYKFFREKGEPQVRVFRISASINGLSVVTNHRISFTSNDYQQGMYVASPQPLLNKDRSYKIVFTLKVVSGSEVFENIPVDRVNTYIADNMDKALIKKLCFETPDKDTPLCISEIGCITAVANL